MISCVKNTETTNFLCFFMFKTVLEFLKSVPTTSHLYFQNVTFLYSISDMLLINVIPPRNRLFQSFITSVSAFGGFGVCVILQIKGD